MQPAVWAREEFQDFKDREEVPGPRDKLRQLTYCDTSLKPTLKEPAAPAGHTSIRKAQGPGTYGNLAHTSPHWHTEVTAPLPPGTPRKKQSRGHGQGRAKARDSLLPSFPDHCDPLTVFRPSNVLDLPSERLILVLQEVLLLRGIPDPQLPRHICRHNGVARATSPRVQGHVVITRLSGWRCL